MQLTDYLLPVSPTIVDSVVESSPLTLVNVLDIYTKTFPDIADVDLAIIGVKEGRFTEHTHTALAADEVRKQLYALAKPKHMLKVVDLGNIDAGSSTNDTLFALNAVVNYLIEKKIAVIILGGTTDLAYAQYTAYQGINRSLNMVCCDSRIVLKQNDKYPERTNYLYKTIAHQPNYLFNVAHLCSQQYFIEQESIDTFERMNFDIARLGQVRSKINETEPVLRNADVFVLSMNSIKAADAPASIEGNPNGLAGDEACQILRYAGMSNELSSIGIFDFDVAKDNDHRTAKLISQMLWYFIDGFYSRKNDYPSSESKDYMIYRTTFQNSSYEIVFYKHILTDRWWMEVPYPNEKSKHKGKFMVPCNYSDYQAALNDEIPDRWMKAYHKLM